MDRQQSEVKQGCPVHPYGGFLSNTCHFLLAPHHPWFAKAARDDNIYGEHRQSDKRKEERKRQNEERGLEIHVIQGDVLLPEEVGW